MSSCIFGKRFILALVLSFLLLSTNIAFASQKIDFSTLDVSISFPDSVVAMYRTMDDIDAASLGFSKNDVLTELSAENCECMAYSSLHDIWFHIGTPSLASFDFSNMSDQEKHETIENYRSYYLDYGYALDSIEFVNTPNTTLLRLQGSISLPSFTRHLIQYYYTYDDYCFFLQAASEGVPFSEHEIAMCDAISKTISYDSFALPFDDLISFENYSSNASKIQFSIPALWYHSETIVEDNDIVERFEPYGSDGFTDILYGDIDISAIAKDAGKANSPNNIIADVFNMTNSEFEEFSINSLTSAYVDPKDAYIYRDTIGSHDYIISCFDVELEVDNKIHVIPHTIFLHVDFNNAYSHYFTYKTMETDLNSAYIEDVWDMIDSVQYPIPDENLSEASPLIRTAHYITSFDENGFATITTSDFKSGIISKDGKIITEPIWSTIGLPREGFYLASGEIMTDERDCFIRSDGTVLANDLWSDAFGFYEGVSRVKGKGGYGYIDHSGNIVIDMQFKRAGWFSEGFAYVMCDNGLYGYIDHTGTVVIDPVWDYAESFNNGVAVVFKGSLNSIGSPEKGLYGLIDSTGAVIIDPVWNHIEISSNGVIIVFKGEVNSLGDPIKGQYGLMDKMGNTLCEAKWDEIGSFSEGFAAIKKGPKYGIIDKEGNVIINPKWADIQTYSNGLARIYTGGLSKGTYGKPIAGKYCFIDTQGKVVLQCDWDYVSSVFNEDMILTFNGSTDDYGKPDQGKYGLINTKGEVIFEPCWDNDFYFSEGYAVVQQNEKYGLIDEWGTLVLPVEWDDLSVPKENLIRATKNGKVGFIDLRGNTIIDFVWDTALSFNNGLTAAKRNGYWYIIDRKGNVKF